MILEGDAEQFGNDDDRQRTGVVGDEIRLAACADALDQVQADLLDARHQIMHPAWRKRMACQSPQACVVGRIALKHRPVQRR